MVVKKWVENIEPEYPAQLVGDIVEHWKSLNNM